MKFFNDIYKKLSSKKVRMVFVITMMVILLFVPYPMVMNLFASLFFGVVAFEWVNDGN